MNAEVVAVGTELLLGQIVNSNAARISEGLASIGVDVHRHVTVGDNLDRIVSAMRSALERADAVIVTGGLGPTPDDITREAVAEATGRRLVRDETLVEKVRAVFERLGREMPDTNLRQADLPEGASAIAPEGTAPGFYLEEGGKLLFAVPGVPWEMSAMLTKVVLPELGRRAGEGTILSREVLVMGLGESHVHERIGDLFDRTDQPTLAYLAGAGQVRVRLTAKAPTESEALGLIRPVEYEVRSRLGDDAVEGNASSMAEAFGEMLRVRGLTVAVAESLTGGLISAELTGKKGSSDYFRGAAVVYQTDTKRDVLGVDEAILAGPGAVSEEAAAAMAGNVAQRFGSDVGISATGVAGPAEQEGKPVGTVFIGASFGGRTETRQVKRYGDRGNIRASSANYAMDLARRLILRS